MPETPFPADDSGNGNFSLDIALEESDIELFITPNNLNETPTDEGNEDILDLLTAVSPIGPEIGMPCAGDVSGGSVLQAAEFNAGFCMSSARLNQTIRDETLRQFSENLSFSSSDKENIPSLATRVKAKTGLEVKRIKGRKSVSNPKQAQELSSGEEEKENTGPVKKPPLPNKACFATISDQELDSLQYDAKAKRTHQQTKWGVTVLTGNDFLRLVFCIINVICVCKSPCFECGA